MTEQTLRMKWKLGETRTQTAQPLHYGGLAQLARALRLHRRGQRFESVILHNCNDSETNDGTDAMYEMETWASPDTNRTDITTLYAGVAERGVYNLET